MKHVPLYPEDLAKRHNKTLSEEPAIHETCIIFDSYIGKWTELMPHTTLVESTFGDFSYTAGHVSIIYTDVGKFSNIASYVRINPGNHPMDRVSMHHMLYRRRQFAFGEDDQAFFDWRRASRCTIGHDTWLGHAATIMPGVSIGNGAVVAAGAVVTKDVPDYTIAGGVPAKPIRRRFPEPIAEALAQTGWWNWDHQTIKERLHEFDDVEAFIEKYSS